MAITLPFPHGTGSGQIANGAVYTDADTPGSTGGRFVGFGEAGTSSIANRAAWALSRNIDTIFTSVLSVPVSASKEKFFTTASGNGNRVQITDTVFCGDNGTGYPGGAVPSVMGMRMLFSVLNPITGDTLLDTSGNEVRVYTVNESTDSTVKYNQGFITNPWVHFCTVNTAGTVVNNSYIIPDGTSVRLVYGAQTYLKDMPTDHVDAFTRYRSSSGSNAGVVLVDGTRAMTGNLSLGSHNITNCGAITAQNAYLNAAQISPSAGVSTSLVMSYTSTGLEPDSVFHTVRIQMNSPNASGFIDLFDDPNHSGSGGQLVFTLNSPTYGTSILLFDGNQILASFRPNTDQGADLGSISTTWRQGYISYLYASSVDISSTLTIPDSRALSVEGPNFATPILLEKGLDYELYQDFALGYYLINDTYPNNVIDDSFLFSATGSGALNHAGGGMLGGRPTTVVVTVDAAATASATIAGDKVRDLTTNCFRHKIGLLMNSALATYKWQSGFSDTGTLDTSAAVYCYLYYYPVTGTIWLARRDVAAGPAFASINTGQTLDVGKFYDIEMVFTPGYVEVFANNTRIVSPAVVFNPEFHGTTVLSYVPLNVDKWAGSDTELMGLDYIYLCSTGHVRRSITGS